MMNARRFPPPWTFEDHNNACFMVNDANGLALAYVYYEQEPGRRTAANLMARDEARRFAANVGVRLMTRMRHGGLRRSSPAIAPVTKRDHR
jgi:endo-1,4-beta-D-glucanase Y